MLIQHSVYEILSQAPKATHERKVQRVVLIQQRIYYDLVGWRWLWNKCVQGGVEKSARDQKGCVGFRPPGYSLIAFLKPLFVGSRETRTIDDQVGIKGVKDRLPI